MACNSELPLESTRKSLPNLFDFVNTLCYECNTPEKMMPTRVRIIVITSGVIVLAWLKNQKNQNQKIVEFFRLTTCRFGTLVCTYSRVLNMLFYTQLMETPFF